MKTNKNNALVSLQGVAVGDALGEMFFGPPKIILPKIENKILPDGIWDYTDDTEMSISVVDTLIKYNKIDQDYLAKSFAKRITAYRGYGRNSYELIEYIKSGMDWRVVSHNAFKGKGSFGNGAASRSTPIGAYFHNDIKASIANAQAAAEITHTHPEGIAGAIAIAIAATYASNINDSKTFDRYDYYQYIIDNLPNSSIRNAIYKLKSLSEKDSIHEIANTIGNGFNVSALDTVPFVIWCSSMHIFDIEKAFWYTVEGLGDRDTTCAMVCGIVALSTKTPIPEEWMLSTEKLPQL